MKTVLFVLIEVIRKISILIQPIMPDSASKILDKIASPFDERTFSNLSDKYAVSPGSNLSDPYPVFPRYLEEVNQNGNR